MESDRVLEGRIPRHRARVAFQRTSTKQAEWEAARNQRQRRITGVVSDPWPIFPTAITKWNQKAGPRVGDWCETKDSGLHRIGAVEAAIRLAAQSGRFSLDTSEGVTYSGLFVDYPAIQKSSLVRLSQSKSGTIHRPHMNLPCRVFKET